MISVDVATVCGDEMRTSYSLIVKHILEEEINYDIVELNIESAAEGYYYVIHEQYPTNGTGKEHLCLLSSLLKYKTIISI